MFAVAMLAMLAAGPAEELNFERMLQCHAYRDVWQWDEHNAGRKVPEDYEWFGAFRDRLRAAGAVKGLDHYKVSDMSNRLVDSLRPKLTPEQNADWAKCQAETGWKPDPSGKTIN